MAENKSTLENETSLRDFVDRVTDAVLKPGSEKEPWWLKPLLAFCAIIYIINPSLGNVLVKGLLENTRNIWEDIKDFLGKIPEKLPRLWAFIEEYAPQVKDKLLDWGNSGVEAIDRLQLIVTTSFANFFDDKRRARLRRRYRIYRNTALILLGIGLLPFATMLFGLAPIPSLPIIRLAGVIGAAMIFVPMYLILWLSLSVTQRKANIPEGHLRRRTNFSELFRIGVILACGWILVGNWLIAPFFLIPMALVLLSGAVFTPTPLAIRNTRRTFMGALGLLMFGVAFSFIADRQPQLHQFVRGIQAPIEFKAAEVWDSARGTDFLTNEEGQRPYRRIKTATSLLKPENFQNGCLTGERFMLLKPGQVVTVQFENRKELKVTQTDEYGRTYRLVILPPHPDSASVVPITGYVFESDLEPMDLKEAYSVRNGGQPLAPTADTDVSAVPSNLPDSSIYDCRSEPSVLGWVNKGDVVQIDPWLVSQYLVWDQDLEVTDGKLYTLGGATRAATTCEIPSMFPAPHLPCAALIIKVPGHDWEVLDRPKTFLVKEAGEVIVGLNDRRGYFNENEGQVLLDIKLSKGGLNI